MAMLIPEAWAGNPHIKPEKQAFTNTRIADGATGRPAAIAFTDGRMIGAALDREGPSRCGSNVQPMMIWW
jgi:glutamate synthase (NADPH/NADH) large chain